VMLIKGLFSLALVHFLIFSFPFPIP
jgi:hypothetical protein